MLTLPAEILQHILSLVAPQHPETPGRLRLVSRQLNHAIVGLSLHLRWVQLESASACSAFFRVFNADTISGKTHNVIDQLVVLDWSCGWDDWVPLRIPELQQSIRVGQPRLLAIASSCLINEGLSGPVSSSNRTQYLFLQEAVSHSDCHHAFSGSRPPLPLLPLSPQYREGCSRH